MYITYIYIEQIVLHHANYIYKHTVQHLIPLRIILQALGDHKTAPERSNPEEDS